LRFHLRLISIIVYDLVITLLFLHNILLDFGLFEDKLAGILLIIVFVVNDSVSYVFANRLGRGCDGDAFAAVRGDARTFASTASEDVGVSLLYFSVLLTVLMLVE
jgi:hypothetical protein